MKKLMILAILAGGLVTFGSMSTAKADHCSPRGYGYSSGFAGRSYGYGFPGRSYGYGGFGSGYRGSYYGGFGGRSSFGYYRPGFSISIGRGSYFGGGHRGHHHHGHRGHRGHRH